MTRQKQIEKAAHDYINSDAVPAWNEQLAFGDFINGCHWADANPDLYSVTRKAVERALENLWHDAQGDYLPDIDREVIVLCDNGKVCFGHRPDPNRSYIGKSIIDGNKMKYKVMTYGKGGWNIPDVKWWLDVELPNMEEEK